MTAEYDEKGAVESATRKVYRHLDDSIASIGGIEVAAGLCGIDRGDLRRSLDRNGRRVAVEFAIAIGARLRTYNATLATQLGSAIVGPMHLEVFPRVTMTAEEKARRLEDAVRAMPMGEQLLEHILGGRR